MPNIEMQEPNIFIIDEDRYNGAYSYHKYTAWLNKIPNDINADHTACADMWYRLKEEGHIYGGGKTPDKALCDLLKKLEKSGQNECCVKGVVLYTGVYETKKKLEKNRGILLEDHEAMESFYPKSLYFKMGTVHLRSRIVMGRPMATCVSLSQEHLQVETTEPVFDPCTL